MASGRGYDLDLSLFERLQGQGFPVASLVLQRRMQPDISALIRATVYPHLQVTGYLPSQHAVPHWDCLPAQLLLKFFEVIVSAVHCLPACKQGGPSLY